MRPRLLIDGSSVCWTSLTAGKDDECGRKVEHEGRLVQVNGAAHGRENAVNMITAAWRKLGIVPMDTIYVTEGRDSKALRIAKYPGYKGGKDAPKTRPAEAYDEFNTLKQMLVDEMRALGGSAVTQDGVEGDDVLAYLAENLEGPVYIMTGDGDLCRLSNDRVKIFKNGEVIENPFGPFDVKYITLYKALVGDTSDKIKGVKGFGDSAFLQTLCTFGEEGLAEFERKIIHKEIATLADDVADCKPLQKVIDQASELYGSYEAASLYPELVNTLRRPLQWMPGFTSRKDCVLRDERYKPFVARAPRLVHGDNWLEVLNWLKPMLVDTPFVTLDIETATEDDSDEWLMRVKGLDADDDLGVDVFGSELVGLGLTFGPNMQYSLYFTVEHLPVEGGPKNLTAPQVLQAVRLIPADTRIIVHNASFELPVLYMTWGHLEADNGWNGFLPNVRDTAAMASYVNENESKGLKECSKLYFDYDQVTFEEVTKGRKMHMIPALEVVDYGTDDTIMTAGLFNHFSVVMEIEKTMAAYLEVEVLPAYSGALSFIQGTPISLQKMFAIEQEDKEAHLREWSKVRDFLIAQGWQGTVCPQWTLEDLKVPSAVKAMHLTILGEELKTGVRIPEKLYTLIDARDDEDSKLLAAFLRTENVAQINDWAARGFEGEPVMDFDSTTQMRKLLFNTLQMPVRLVNKATVIERKEKPELAKAIGVFNKIRAGKTSEALTEEQHELLKKKAKTDSKQIGFNLLYEDGTPELRAILASVQIIKTIETRTKLFYNKYRTIGHWKDGLIHSSFNQTGPVTRRYSCSGPNLQQLPKKGEGVKFREVFIPHCADGVIISIDFAGQELRLSADLSRDANLLACYIGDNLKDVHSLTASVAMRRKLGVEVIEKAYGDSKIERDRETADYELFCWMRKPSNPLYKLADDLRKGSKNVNFASHYDALPPKISETLIIPISDAEEFLKAKEAMFPRFTDWKDEVKNDLNKTGIVTTYKGARRHLAHKVLHDDKWEREGAERMAPNYKIQGSGAEQIKLAIGEIWKSGVLFRLDGRLIGPVHDELVASCSIDDAVEMIRVMHTAMVRPYMDIVPAVGSISVGPTFGKQIECGDEFDEVAIRAALDKVRSMREEAVAA